MLKIIREDKTSKAENMTEISVADSNIFPYAAM